MRNQVRSIALRLACIAALGAWAVAPAAAAVSVGYAGLAVWSEGMIHGAQATVSSSQAGLGFTADAAYFHGDDGYALLAAGPRWSSRTAGGSRVFFQIVGGFLAGGDGGFFAAPGAGMDFAANQKLGGRLQVDGPFLFAGGIAQAVRVSAAIVWRPGRRAHPAAEP